MNSPRTRIGLPAKSVGFPKIRHFARVALAFWLALLPLLVPPPALSRAANSPSGAARKRPALCRRLVLTGEAFAGQPWSAAIGQGWVFRLVPIASGSAPGFPHTGWDLAVSPLSDLNYPDALLLATPPYGSLNEREIGTTYGMRAQDAIAWEPRRFRFLASVAQLERARELFQAILPAPGTNSARRGRDASEQGQSAAKLLAMLGAASHLGSGEFAILDARLSPGIADPPAFARQWATRLSQTPHASEPAAGPPTPRGELHWLRFRAALTLPSGWTPPTGIPTEAANCAE